MQAARFLDINDIIFSNVKNISIRYWHEVKVEIFLYLKWLIRFSKTIWQSIEMKYTIYFIFARASSPFSHYDDVALH